MANVCIEALRDEESFAFCTRNALSEDPSAHVDRPVRIGSDGNGEVTKIVFLIFIFNTIL